MHETEAEPLEATAAWKGHKVPRAQLVGGHVRVTGNRQRLSGLATILENSVHRPVVDRTGLTGVTVLSWNSPRTGDRQAHRPTARFPISSERSRSSWA